VKTSDEDGRSRGQNRQQDDYQNEPDILFLVAVITTPAEPIFVS
jgi:hypothetical protein